MFGLKLVLAVAAGISVGLVFALAVTRWMRKSKRFRIGATVVAGLFSFMTYRDPGERAVVEESESETRRKKEKQSGDPPDQD